MPRHYDLRTMPCVLILISTFVFLALPTSSLPQPSASLTLGQKKEIISRVISRMEHRLPPQLVDRLLTSLHPSSASLNAMVDPDLAKDRLLHAWATNNVTCTKVKTCISFASDVCAEVCQDGSLQPDPWTTYALRTQREIQYDTPLNRASLPGTHNSAITLANGYGLSESVLNYIVHMVSNDWQVYIANQQLGLWDQFKIGIRHFELDIHWWNDAVRICHAGGIHIQYLNEFIHLLAEEFGIDIDWDSETIGCFSPADRTLNSTFAEIKKFLFAPENENEFTIFYFDDQEDLHTWGKVGLILQGIEYHFGSSVFTPVDKKTNFPYSWPTFRQLQAAGKRLMFVSRTDYAQEMDKVMFSRAALWTEYGPFPFAPYPNCTVKGQPLDENSGIVRILGGSLAYGPFANEYDGQMIMPEDLLEEAQCNVNFACVDQVSPLLAQGYVWSWDQGQPSTRGGCAAMQPNGRWATLDCATQLPSACKAANAFAPSFALSANATAWGAGSCAAGLQFGLPVNGFENSQLKALRRTGPVWINHKAS